eukprot:scaffold17977_cov96-Isochrysis_galbana.AAC.1
MRGKAHCLSDRAQSFIFSLRLHPKNNALVVESVNTRLPSRPNARRLRRRSPQATGACGLRCRSPAAPGLS